VKAPTLRSPRLVPATTARTIRKEENFMFRTAYLASLVVLQIALMIDIAPSLAEFIRVQSAVLQAWDTTAALLRLGVATTAATGVAIVLATPVLALLRHHQRGGLRFLGLPRWWVRCAIAGAALFALALLAPHAIAIPQVADLEFLEELEQPLQEATIAMMAGGTIAAELLRRSVAPPLVLRECMPIRHIHVEIAPHADGRTRAA
jgi:hypothetical protein